MALEHHALEHLDAFLLALDDLVMHAHGVADAELRQPLAGVSSFDLREQVRRGHGAAPEERAVPDGASGNSPNKAPGGTERRIMHAVDPASTWLWLESARLELDRTARPVTSLWKSWSGRLVRRGSVGR